MEAGRRGLSARPRIFGHQAKRSKAGSSEVTTEPRNWSIKRRSKFSRFTRWVRHRRLAPSRDKPLCAISESRRPLQKSERHPGNAGYY
jgi:hypothetical protein